MHTNDYKEKSKKAVLDPNNVADFSSALTRFSFNSCPQVHDLVKAQKITEDELLEISSFITNRLAGVFNAAKEDQWFQLECFLNYHNRNKPLYIKEVTPDSAAVMEIFQREIEEDL